MLKKINQFIKNKPANLFFVSNVTLISIFFSIPSRAVDFEKTMKQTPAGVELFASGGHAYCEVSTEKNSKIAGYHTDELVSIASVSKIFTSLWALEVLGADFRFQNNIYIWPGTNKDTYNVHISGSLDPAMSRQSVYLILSELNRLGINNIQELTFDENFRVFLDVLIRSVKEDPEQGFNSWTSIDETQNNLQVLFNRSQWTQNTLDKYNGFAKYVTAVGLKLPQSVNIKAEKVYNIPRQEAAQRLAQIQASGVGVKKYTQRSSPLYTYLKKMNVKSNNYMSDTLWLRLGGEAAFNKHATEKWKFTDKDLQFHSGSGLPDRRGGKRKDNLATCNTVTLILKRLESVLQKSELDLTDVMMVSGVDQGTLGSLGRSEWT
ncbi:MAG: D-alanyl-D-alanine carboxypeptidase, partial [Pseudobdellovibrionaceae bacterium]